MIEKPRLLAVVIALTLVGVLGLYAYAVTVESKQMSIYELGPQHVGTLVEVEGHICEVSAWDDGALNLELIDYDSGVRIQVEVDKEAAEDLDHQDKFIPGARVRVNGLVADYYGELTIQVTSTEGIQLLQTANDNVLKLEIILERPEVFRDLDIVVIGTVWDMEAIDSINAVTFTLHEDGEGGYYSVNCIVFNSTDLRDENGLRVWNGDKIRFTGTFDYYAPSGIWQIRSSDGKESIESLD